MDLLRGRPFPEVWDALCVAAGRAVEAVHRALGASGTVGEAVGRAPTRSALGRNQTVAAVAGVGAFAAAVVWLWPGPPSLGAGIALLVAAALEQLAWSENVWRISLYVWWFGMVVEGCASVTCGDSSVMGTIGGGDG